MLIIMTAVYLSSKKQYNNVIKTFSITYLSSLHLQLLIGIVLYFFLSPFTQLAFNDFGAAMKNADLRYWAVEHSLLNIVAIVIAQIGFSKAKRRADSTHKLKTLLIWNSIAFVIVLLAIPMGILGVERPWFRF